MNTKEIKLFIDSQPVFKAVAEVANSMNVEAFAIGGYVRDLFLDRDSKDLDIVVSDKGLEFAEQLSKKLDATEVHMFKNFGTAQLIFGDLEIEIVGARKESYRANSRNPEVQSGTLKEDRERRDFTINALSISLNRASFGEVIDPFDGLKDLEEGRIITPLDPNNNLF